MSGMIKLRDFSDIVSMKNSAAEPQGRSLFPMTVKSARPFRRPKVEYTQDFPSGM